MESMEVEYRLTPEDALALGRYLEEHDADGRKKPRTRPLVWVFVVLMAVAMAVTASPAAIAEMLSQNAGVLDWLRTLAVPTLLVTALVLYLLRWRMTGAQVRKVFQDPEAARWVGPWKLAISPAGIRTTLDQVDETLSWYKVLQVRATEDHAFFFTGPSRAIVVPYRAFVSREAFAEFVQAAMVYHANRRAGSRGAT